MWTFDVRLAVAVEFRPQVVQRDEQYVHLRRLSRENTRQADRHRHANRKHSHGLHALFFLVVDWTKHERVGNDVALRTLGEKLHIAIRARIKLEFSQRTVFRIA